MSSAGKSFFSRFLSCSKFPLIFMPRVWGKRKKICKKILRHRRRRIKKSATFFPQRIQELLDEEAEICPFFFGSRCQIHIFSAFRSDMRTEARHRWSGFLHRVPSPLPPVCFRAHSLREGDRRAKTERIPIAENNVRRVRNIALRQNRGKSAAQRCEKFFGDGIETHRNRHAVDGKKDDPEKKGQCAAHESTCIFQ